MFRCRFFLHANELVRDDLVTSGRLSVAYDKAREILDQRRYLRAEIWRGDRMVAHLAPSVLRGTL